RTANTPSENALSRSGVALWSTVVPFPVHCVANALRNRPRAQSRNTNAFCKAFVQSVSGFRWRGTFCLRNLTPTGGSVRIVAHVDMDAFYAAVEAQRDPALRDRPLVVRADPTEGHGRGEPETIYVRDDHALYREVSARIMAILAAAGDAFQKTSVDEAYLELSSLGSVDAAVERARRLKAEIVSQEGLTASVGIGPNKIVAKIASDFDKPDGLTVVRP